MMNTDFLKQGKNTLEAVGTLITNGIEVIDQNGKEVVRGQIVIECIIEDKINELQFEVYAQSHFKNFNDLKSAADLPDRKTALNEDMAAKIRIIGGIELNEYINRDNKLVSHTRNKAVIINQTDKTTEDSCIVQIGGIIDKKVVGEDGNLTLDILAVDYQNRILDITEGIKVPSQYKDMTDELYNEGDTASVAFTPNNTVTILEPEQSVAFGMVLDDTKKDYNSENVLVGAYPPMKDGARYTDEEVEKIRQLRKDQLAELEAKIVPDSGASGGFGGGFGATADPSNPFA